MAINEDKSERLYIVVPKGTKERLMKSATQNQRSMSKEAAYAILQYLEAEDRKAEILSGVKE